MDKYQNRTLEDLRSSYRAIGRKLDALHIEAAIAVEVLPLKPGRKFWVATEIDWEDPRIPGHLKQKVFELSEKHYQLGQVIGKREAIEKDDLPRWEARQVAYGWLNVLGDEADNWLIKHHLTTVSLTESLLENPNFLEEVFE